MEPKRMIELTVGIVVGLVVFSAILMPVVTGAEKTARYTVNENSSDNYTHTMDLINDDVTIEINYVDDASDIDVTVGEKEYAVDVSTVNNITKWLFYSDVCMLWVDRVSGVNNPVYALKSTNYTGGLSGVSSIFTYDHATKIVTLSINGTETFTDTVEKFAYVYTGDDGKYGYFPTAVTVSADSTVEMFRGGGWWDNTFVTYTATAKEWYQSATTPINGMVITKDQTPTEYDAEYASSYWVDNGNGTYTRNNASATVIYNDGAEDVTVSAGLRVIAPIEYVSYDTNTISDLIGIIPILIIAGLIVGIAATVISRRE